MKIVLGNLLLVENCTLEVHSKVLKTVCLIFRIALETRLRQIHWVSVNNPLIKGLIRSVLKMVIILSYYLEQNEWVRAAIFNKVFLTIEYEPH